MYNDNHNNHNENNINVINAFNVGVKKKQISGRSALFSTSHTRNWIELNWIEVFDGNYRYLYSLFDVGVSVSISVGCSSLGIYIYNITCYSHNPFHPVGGILALSPLPFSFPFFFVALLNLQTWLLPVPLPFARSFSSTTLFFPFFVAILFPALFPLTEQNPILNA